MRILNRFSIKNKLIVIVLLVTSITLTIGFSVVIINDIRTFRQDMVDSTNMSAQLIGWSCISALAFEDKQGVQDILTRIELLPSIVSVYVYNNSDTLFASLGKEKGKTDKPFIGDIGFSRFNQEYLLTGQPIIYQGDRYGSIYLRASTAQLTQKTKKYVMTMIVLMAGLVLVTYLLANSFQKLISRPILKLAELTKRVSSEADYSVRATKQNEDEIGILYDGFNSMLHQIEHRETAREKAEEDRQDALSALETEHAQLLSIFDSMDEVIYIADPHNYTLLYGNEEFRRNWGNSIGQKCFQALQGRNSPCTFCTNAKIFGENLGKTYIWETQNELNQRWYRCIDRAIKWTDGTMVRFEMAIDYSDLKTAQLELKANVAKYQSMMEAMRDPIYICSNDFRIQYMNRAMINRIGSDATGEFCFKALHDLNEKCSWCQDQDSFNKAHTEINIISPKDGKSYSVSSSILTNEDGSSSKLSVLRDTTEFIALQTRLQQAQKMETIGNLAGGIAHDFNNILCPIIGMSELLVLDLPTDSLERKNAEAIFKAGKRGGDLVGQILAISRQSDSKVIPTLIQHIIKEVIKLTRSTIPAYIEIKADIEQNCGMVMADSTQIHQVGMNLITNAYHAVEEMGGEISVTLKQTLVKDPEAVEKNISPGPYVVLSVSDTGHGISEKLLNKVFDPYFTTKEQGKGTGLGLAMVYGIVKKHDGEIKVHSEIGKGSIFDVYLPLMEDFDIVELIPATDKDPRGNERILLVDDEKSIAELEQQVLERLGYKVTFYWHSIEALEAFRNDPDSFDLVITDMNMPKMAGDEFIHKVKSIRPDIPIIICTGFSERVNQDVIKALAINGLLMKPVMKSDLAHIVRKVLEEAEVKTDT